MHRKEIWLEVQEENRKAARIEASPEVLTRLPADTGVARGAGQVAGVDQGVSKDRGMRWEGIGEWDTVLVGRVIQQLRLEKQVSQRVLGKALGMQQNTFSRIEVGKRDVTMEELLKICECLGVGLFAFCEAYQDYLTRTI